jgi:fructokinase
MRPNDGPLLCLGEVVWDLYPDGPAIGGAPFNVAVHLARQGLPVKLATAVGRDPLGARTRAFLEEEGLEGWGVHPARPTGTVDVCLEEGGVPRYAIRGDCAWMDLEGVEHPAGMPWEPPPRLLVFGGLAMHGEANRRLLSRILDGERPLAVCDLNLRPGWADPQVIRWCLDRADVLKVNEEELATLLSLEGLGREDDLLARHRFQALCVTLGPRGLLWLDRQEGRKALPVEEGLPVVDTVGAGDAMTAALAMGLHRGEAAAAFLRRGLRWAAAVCAVRGALPPRGILKA